MLFGRDELIRLVFNLTLLLIVITIPFPSDQELPLQKEYPTQLQTTFTSFVIYEFETVQRILDIQLETWKIKSSEFN